MNTKFEALVGLATLVSEDARRTIHEYNDPVQDFSVQLFKIESSIPLGNHYHEKKDEKFVITAGGGFVRLQSKEERAEEKNTFREMRLQQGSVVTVPAGVTHTFVLQEGSTMICFSSKAFDAKDMYSNPLMTAEEALELIRLI